MIGLWLEKRSFLSTSWQEQQWLEKFQLCNGFSSLSVARLRESFPARRQLESNFNNEHCSVGVDTMTGLNCCSRYAGALHQESFELESFLSVQELMERATSEEIRVQTCLMTRFCEKLFYLHACCLKNWCYRLANRGVDSLITACWISVVLIYAWDWATTN